MTASSEKTPHADSLRAPVPHVTETYEIQTYEIRERWTRVVPLVRRLLLANLVLAVLLVGHIADHTLRQPAGGQLDGAANAPGLLGALAVFISFGLVAAGYRYAPHMACVIGILTALGFVAVHLAPNWSMFSDPYADRSLDTASWIQMLTALTGGLLLAYEARRAAPRGPLRTPKA